MRCLESLLLYAVAYAPLYLSPIHPDTPSGFFGRWAAEQMQGSLRQTLRARERGVLWT